MYIKRFLIVSCIVSLIILVGCKGDFYKFNDEDSLLEINIPRINLKREVYNIDSSMNDVDKNIEILQRSSFENNLFFLASHSGGGKASYFDDLIYLEIGDIIWLCKDNEMYAFVVEEVFYINKNGYFDAQYNKVGNTLFLITCSLDYVDKQLIIKAKLIYKC